MRVESLLPGCAAEKSGNIQVGDEIVAVDGEGKPREVPAWTPRTDEERALRESAEERLEARRARRRESPTVCEAPNQDDLIQKSPK